MIENINQPPATLFKLPARNQKPARTLGIVGGGQLAKMLAQSASQFGCAVVLLERNDHSPASILARDTVIGDWDNPDKLLRLGSLVDVVTLENEFVNAESLAVLEQFGYDLFPTSGTMNIVQDKFLQKQALAKAGLPVPEFLPVVEKADLVLAGGDLGWPLVLKKRRNGYDGKGNFTLRKPDDIDAAWAQLGGNSTALYLEQFCDFAAELAIIVVRDRNGEMVTYPVVETIQRNHVCTIVKAPAGIPDSLAAKIAEYARTAAAATGMVGAMGVELFLKKDGAILINELAPRVHNSGHYTIEACVSSQFENHIRAVMGWTLGSTEMRAPAAVMVNLLAQARGFGAPQGLGEAMAIPGAHPHIYGKDVSVPGRKMGHVTALGQTVAEAQEKAQRAASLIRFGVES
jgi:5-(carboxyamino)imidazole ribonucleotide synthase